MTDLAFLGIAELTERYRDGILTPLTVTEAALARIERLEMPRGTTLDIMLDRPLYLDPAKVNFTDPGRASSLAGPPNRQPQRQRVPF